MLRGEIAVEQPYGKIPGNDLGAWTRAIMERAAWRLRALLEKLGGPPEDNRMISTGGGARSDVWLQINADILGLDFIAVEAEEPACLAAGAFPASALGRSAAPAPTESVASASASMGVPPQGSAATSGDERQGLPVDWIRIKKVFKPNLEKRELYLRILQNKT